MYIGQKRVRNLTVSSGSCSCLGLLIMCNSSSRVFGLTFNDRHKAVHSSFRFSATNQRKFKSFQEQVKKLGKSLLSYHDEELEIFVVL